MLLILLQIDPGIDLACSIYYSAEYMGYVLVSDVPY